ncbi:MAG: ornithine--oxo-acid transaminase [Limnochordia bacterium]|nr:ornithine--oxo-acid transaminase [Limnochordia bacterium]MDI9465625.1 ornithine--oxo-acid transaminase [Bacillota bacterium]HOB39498.1 ornithine--oxo-acid transaminase [Limnochordia bacterium]HPZ79038.1 ornithine--oxo-acid transaminase [Limnochordia bacterium]HQE35558.1 ornithine--oxo-acid transaminase [Limnochordia bacterium]
MARTEEFIREVDRYSARNYNPLPVVIERGEGVWVWDVEGNKYLDMLSAYSALNQGHRHPKIISALMEQAGKCTLTSRAFHNETMGPFLKTLCELAGYGKALPMNTGAEAVETAIKAARKWGLVRKGVPENQGEIIVCENNFHGRTVTIISFSSEEQYRYGFGPYTPGFVLVPYGDLEALEKAITPHTVAVLAEPIQGEGGVVVPPQGYLAKMRELATEHNLLMMLDEIQTGLGRTGRLFAYEHEGAKPDVLILGKALGGGVYPVSAVLASEEVLGVFNPGDHGSTFGGNPLGAAVAQAALEVILEEDLPGRAEQLGNYFLEGLKALNSPYVREIRGRGLLIGVEIKTEYGSARPFCQRLMAEGLLCKETHEQTIRFAPPLVISKEEIDWALERIQKVLGA